MSLARWDHNRHYHGFLLEQVPPRAEKALDVGCGAGRLARALAARGLAVDALDRSAQMIELARALDPQTVGNVGRDDGAAVRGRVRYLVGDVLNSPQQCQPPGGYDVVTCVACLHHLPTRTGLLRLRGLVAPGGLLAVVGLYRTTTPVDHALAAATIPADLTVRCLVTLRNRGGNPGAGGEANQGEPEGPQGPSSTWMPTNRAIAGLPEIRRLASEHLPGARIRRRLFWRYTLLWRSLSEPTGPRTGGTREAPQRGGGPHPRGAGPSRTD
jgi:SAM-dependent methyltransferase